MTHIFKIYRIFAVEKSITTKQKSQIHMANNNNLPIVEVKKNGSIVYCSRSTEKKTIRRPLFSSIWLSRRPFLRGIASLGNLNGKSSFLKLYMKGSFEEDVRHDWECVGYDIYKAMSLYR